MKYIIIIFLLLVFIYQMSFVKYNWTKKNKPAAVGSAILGVLGLLLPLFVMFSDKFEI